MIEIDNIFDIEKHLDGIEAVIFDLDDTLYSEKDYVRSGYKAIAGLFPAIGTMEDELWSAFENKEPAIDVILERHGLICEKEKAVYAYRFNKPDIKLYDGVAEMISRIRTSKKVGIITDGRPEGQYAKIKSLGIEADEIIVTDELGGVEFRKPNDAAFRLMAKNLDVPFKGMVYIGDNTEKDFIGPEKLGMKSIYFRNPDGLYSGERTSK